jgi:choline dehydrogenase-like flavoprotein
MHIDLDAVQAAAHPTPYTSQVCILGAGIAGLILAHRLAARGLHVHLLEAGGLTLEPRSQSLYDSEFPRDTHTGTTQGRFRTFGGSSTRWGGQLLPYTPDIFAPDPAVPSPAWPISAADLEPFYPEVLEIMGVDALPFDASLLTALDQPPSTFPAEELTLRFSKWAPFSRRNLANSLGKECLAHQRITVFTHANAIALNQRPSGGSIASVTAVNYAGQMFCFDAAQFLVALGTIESSRLLLASATTCQPAPGNQFDQVGRYFHDHLSLRAAAIEGPARARLLSRLGPFFVDGTLHTAKLEAAAALRRQHALPAAMAHIVIEEPEDSGLAALRSLLQSIQRGKLADAITANLPGLLRGLPDVARLAYDTRIRRRRSASRRARLWLHIDVEQLPTPDSRIRLSSRRDALNQSVAVVDWAVTSTDRDTAARFAPLLRTALDAAGVPPLSWFPEPPPPTDTYHPMGGLRMGTGPRDSVVGPNLKVHGLDNLYIASCATFPSGGSSNPTFTLMALALRLAQSLPAA